MGAVSVGLSHNSASSVMGEKSSPSSGHLTNPLVLDCKIQNRPGEGSMKEGGGSSGVTPPDHQGAV